MSSAWATVIFFGVGEEVAQAANRLKNPKTLAKRFTLPPFSSLVALLQPLAPASMK
jgi:hypothetical protein